MAADDSNTIDATTDFGLRQVPIKDKADHVRQVFDSVSPRYDLMNDVMSLGTHRAIKWLAAEYAAVRKGNTVLDVAAGSGDMSRLLARRVGASGLVLMSDINASMLAVGRDRLLDAGHAGNVATLQADAEALPLPDASVDRVTIAFGLRNITRKEKALGEFARVLRPGGRLLVLEFSKPTQPLLASAFAAWRHTWPLFGRAIAGDADSYRYLGESIQVHTDADTLLQMLQAAGFEFCRHHALLGGAAAVHLGIRP